MKLVSTSDITRERWNSFVAQWPGFELMQSYEWGTFKEILGWRAIRLAVVRDGRMVAGAQMLIRPLPLRLVSVAYVPRGPLLYWDDEEAVQVLLPALHASARRHRAISLKIEPAIHYSSVLQQRLESEGFCRSSFSNQPQCSMLIDLTPDPDTILANMHKTTRYNIRYSARKGVIVREATADDLDTMYRLLEFTATRAGFPIRSCEYYCREWHTLASCGYVKAFLAQYQGEILAMRMPARFGNRAATLHSGSFDIHHELKPNELLMWESLQWAKAQGCVTYDVWGIPDQVGANLYLGHSLPKQREGGLWGVYEFKRGFGGNVVYYVGAFDFIYCRLLYGLVNMAMARLGSLEKLAQLGDRLNVISDQSVGL